MYLSVSEIAVFSCDYGQIAFFPDIYNLFTPLDLFFFYFTIFSSCKSSSLEDDWDILKSKKSL